MVFDSLDDDVLSRSSHTQPAAIRSCRDISARRVPQDAAARPTSIMRPHPIIGAGAIARADPIIPEAKNQPACRAICTHQTNNDAKIVNIEPVVPKASHESTRNS